MTVKQAMTTVAPKTNTTTIPMDAAKRRLTGLRRLALSTTAFNILGYAYLGFEPAIFQVFFTLIVAYGTTVLLETVDAWANQRTARYYGQGFIGLMDFLLPAHIAALSITMLLYTNDRLGPMALAAVLMVSSKYILKVNINGRMRHFFNPSNFGIVFVLLLFPWVANIPYHFTNNLSGMADWMLPIGLFLFGGFLNATIARRIPLIVAWLLAFAAQAIVRSFLFDGTLLVASLMPMTGTAFILFTFFMITDPGTTPFTVKGQVIFAVATAVIYGTLLALHVVFALFFCLFFVGLGRGLYYFYIDYKNKKQTPNTPMAVTS